MIRNLTPVSGCSEHDIEGGGIETATAPREGVIVFVMRRIADSLEEVCISWRTAHVFRRTRVAPVQAQ